jgi:hypothetical protein
LLLVKVFASILCNPACAVPAQTNTDHTSYAGGRFARAATQLLAFKSNREVTWGWTKVTRSRIEPLA